MPLLELLELELEEVELEEVELEVLELELLELEVLELLVELEPAPGCSGALLDPPPLEQAPSNAMKASIAICLIKGKGCRETLILNTPIEHSLPYLHP